MLACKALDIKPGHQVKQHVPTILVLGNNVMGTHTLLTRSSIAVRQHVPPSACYENRQSCQAVIENAASIIALARTPKYPLQPYL